MCKHLIPARTNESWDLWGHGSSDLVKFYNKCNLKGIIKNIGQWMSLVNIAKEVNVLFYVRSSQIASQQIEWIFKLSGT